jgi:preprotein translocase subunit SecY
MFYPDARDQRCGTWRNFSTAFAATTGGGNVFTIMNMFSGRSLEKLTVFSLGVMPYISSSIIMQLLTAVIPSLEKLSKEGQAGHQKINQYTRYGTVLLGLVQSFFIALWLESPQAFQGLAGR